MHIDMKNRTQQLDQFFDLYEERFNKALRQGIMNIEETAGAFADSFIEASPVGIACGKNDEKFREMIPKGYEFYENIGTSSIDILSKDIILLDDFHAMVKVYWDCKYTKKDDSRGHVEFNVMYFVQSMNNTHKIFAYITGDEQKVLKEEGLID